MGTAHRLDGYTLADWESLDPLEGTVWSWSTGTSS
jgi:hypothetical protein